MLRREARGGKLDAVSTTRCKLAVFVHSDESKKWTKNGPRRAEHTSRGPSLLRGAQRNVTLRRHFSKNESCTQLLPAALSVEALLIFSRPRSGASQTVEARGGQAVQRPITTEGKHNKSRRLVTAGVVSPEHPEDSSKR